MGGDWLQEVARETEFFQNGRGNPVPTVSVYERGALYHPRVQYIRTLLFAVIFFHFFYFLLNFTAEAFGFKDFRM